MDEIGGAMTNDMAAERYRLRAPCSHLLHPEIKPGKVRGRRSAYGANPSAVIPWTRLCPRLLAADIRFPRHVAVRCK